MAFDYTICGEYNTEKYHETVARIAKTFPDFRVKKEVVDPLDGDMIQVFERGNDEIRIVNDYMTGAVYIQSTIEIVAFRVAFFCKTT